MPDPSYPAAPCGSSSSPSLPSARLSDWLRSRSSPYESLKEHVDPLAVDRDAGLSRAEFDDLVLRLRLVAVAFATLAGALVLLGRRLDGVVADVLTTWWRALRGAPSALRTWVATEDRGYIIGFGVILITAVLLRLAFLDVPMRYDEATTYDNYVSKPVWVALANYSTPNNHLFHTFLAKLSVTALGNDPWVVRLPALVAGIALIPATFALALVLHGRVAAIVAAGLVAVSSTFVEYSTNARGYTIVALVTVLMLIAAVRALEGGSTGSWATIAVLGAVGLHTVPTMIYPIAGVYAWLLLAQAAREGPFRPLFLRAVWSAGTLAVLTGLLYAPVVVASGIRSVTSNEFVERRSWGSFLDELPAHAGNTLETWYRDLPTAVGVVLGICLVASLLLTPRLSRIPVPPFAVMVGVALVTLTAQRVVPFTRTWLFLLPLAFVAIGGLVGRGLETRFRVHVIAPIAAGLIAIIGAALVLRADTVRTSRETGALLDAPAVASYLAGVASPPDRILATGSDTILEYYLERKGIDAGRMLYDDTPRDRTFVVVNVLGGQAIDDLLDQLPNKGAARPRLLERYDSALVYRLDRDPG